MSRNGILIDYEYCSNCHTCEVACKMELGIPEGKWGIRVFEVGPWNIEGDKWQTHLHARTHRHVHPV